jgi:hypothetical protein
MEEVLKLILIYTYNKNTIIDALILSSIVFEYLKEDMNLKYAENITKERLILFSIKDIINNLSDIIYVKSSNNSENIEGIPQEILKLMIEMSIKFSNTILNRALDVLVNGEGLLRYSTQPKTYLEMICLKASSIRNEIEPDKLILRIKALEEELDKIKENGIISKPADVKDNEKINKSVDVKENINDKSNIKDNDVKNQINDSDKTSDIKIEKNYQLLNDNSKNNDSTKTDTDTKTEENLKTEKNFGIKPQEIINENNQKDKHTEKSIETANNSINLSSIKKEINDKVQNPESKIENNDKKDEIQSAIEQDENISCVLSEENTHKTNSYRLNNDRKGNNIYKNFDKAF